MYEFITEKRFWWNSRKELYPWGFFLSWTRFFFFISKLKHEINKQYIEFWIFSLVIFLEEKQNASQNNEKKMLDLKSKIYLSCH